MVDTGSSVIFLPMDVITKIISHLTSDYKKICKHSEFGYIVCACPVGMWEFPKL